MSFVFQPATLPSLSVAGTQARYPVRRIFCVGRNYAAHAAEMGGEVDREAPWYFCKSAFALGKTGQTLPYPKGTANFHHEIELVVALGAADGDAVRVFGYASGLDMTRRDRQQDGKDHRRPWDLGKDFENSAIIGGLTLEADCADIATRTIALSVNGETRQEAKLSDMVWSVEEVISHLSQFYNLGPGDLIMTGTPAGVGPVVTGDVLHGGVEGLEPVSMTVGPPDA